jgi:FkbM family methyltransferase
MDTLRPVKGAIRGILSVVDRAIAPLPPDPWYLLRNDLLQLFSRCKIDCVLDVGAHTGEYGTFLRDIGYDGHIVSFEPVRENYPALEAARNGDSRWRIFPFALGEENTSQPIHVTGSTVFSSFLPPNQFGTELFTKAGVERTELAEVRRLDNVLDECLAGIPAQRIYLKIDTQGWDLRVLAGAAGVLDRVAALQSEISVQNIYTGMPNYLESLEVIGRMGFKPFGFVPVSRDRDHGIVEFDCIMIRGSGKPAASPA